MSERGDESAEVEHYANCEGGDACECDEIALIEDEPAPENDRISWSCNACPWVHAAHPLYGWSERDDRAVEVHQTMLCPDAVTADGHACIGDDCPGCVAALARVIPPGQQATP